MPTSQKSNGHLGCTVSKCLQSDCPAETELSARPLTGAFRHYAGLSWRSGKDPKTEVSGLRDGSHTGWKLQHWRVVLWKSHHQMAYIFSVGQSTGGQDAGLDWEGPAGR